MQIVDSEGKWIADFPDQDLNGHSYILRTNFTIDVKFRAFQYEYLLRILPNNKFLCKCKIASSVLCDFCSKYEETNAHLFWECWYVQNFWSKTQNY